MRERRRYALCLLVAIVLILSMGCATKMNDSKVLKFDSTQYCNSEQGYEILEEELPFSSYVLLANNEDLMRFNARVQRCGISLEKHDFSKSYLLITHVFHKKAIVRDLQYSYNNGAYIVTDILTEEQNNQTTNPSDSLYIYETPPVELDFINFVGDINAADWYAEACMQSIKYGWLNKKTNGNFYPNQYASRYEMINAIWHISGCTEGADKNIFSDYPAEDWRKTPINWGYENKIIEGIGDGTFRPNDNITREQMMTILKRYCEYSSCMTSPNQLTKKTFSDGNQVSEYAEEAVDWAVSNGLLNGYEDNTIRPQGKITRAELATVLLRFERIIS